MQGVIVVEQSIAANSTVANIFAGSQFATVNSPTVCSAAVTGNVTGLLTSIAVGGRIVVEPSAPPVATVMPKIPDDFFYTFGALAAETIQCRVQNTTGAAVTVRAVVQLADG